MLAGVGFCIGFGITLWDTMPMERVPDHMLARVISIDWFGLADRRIRDVD